MQYLNLNFTPVYEAGNSIEFKSFTFPGGEQHIKLSMETMKVETTINVRLNTAQDFMMLALAVDALRRIGIDKINAYIPYLPYARQDRVMVQGEPFSMKVFAKMLNALELDKITVLDAHSDVSLALLDNVEGRLNHTFVKNALYSRPAGDYNIVCPDAGAYKKIFKLCESLGYKNELVVCNKDRDIATGEIKGISVNFQDLDCHDCYIVDDICDGGRTFIEIAKVLKERNAGNIYLLVTHGIFSTGEEPLKPYIKHIFTTNSINDVCTDFITRITL